MPVVEEFIIIMNPVWEGRGQFAALTQKLYPVDCHILFGSLCQTKFNAGLRVSGLLSNAVTFTTFYSYGRM
jgi:hypothetical protein